MRKHTHTCPTLPPVMRMLERKGKSPQNFLCRLGVQAAAGRRGYGRLSRTIGIGFTVALFVSIVAFPQGALQDSVKMGALFSFFVAPVTLLIAKLIRKKSA